MAVFPGRRFDVSPPEDSDISVLHVDDDQPFAEVVSTFLERADSRFTIETAESAAAGMDRLQSAEFDCLVSDYDMPEQNGIEFLREVRCEFPDLPFILYTGKGSEEVASEAISAGVTDYLQKESGTGQYTVLANRILNAVERDRVRTQLTDNQRHLQLFFERSPLGVIEWNESLEVVRMNEAAEGILGYDESELQGKSWETIVPEEIHNTVESELSWFKTGKGFQHVNDNIRADGERIICEWHNQVVTDEDGEIVSMFSKFQDVTEREQQTRHLETLLDNIPGMVYRCRYEQEWPMEKVAGEVESLTGYTAAYLEKDECFYAREVIHPEDQQEVWNRTNEAIAENGQFEVTYRIVTADGETRWAWERGQGIYEGGEPVAIEGFVTDITDRVAAEEKLTALHNFADTLTTSSTAEEVCQRTIEASEEILDFDLSAIDLARDGMLEIVAVSSGTPPEGSRTMSPDEGIVGKTYQTGESSLIPDVQEVPKAEPQGPYRATISIPIGDHGVFQAVAREAGAFDERDLELAELLVNHAENALTRIDREEELERRNERLDDFAGIVSHDLRNPLNVAQGRVQLALEETQNQHLGPAADAIDRSFELIDDLLALARLGDEDQEIEPVALADIAGDCWTVVDTADAEFVIETNQTILAHPGRLRQLLENLYRNAVEHGATEQAVSRDGGEPSVTVTVGDCEGGFYVTDDGPGVPEEMREKVFEPGYSKSGDGTGFGLSIVHQVAEAHGWTIELTGDEGARFEITGVEQA